MRRLGVALGLVLLVLVAILAGLWWLRVPVLQGVLDGVVAARLGVPVEARVERVEHDGLVIEELSLGGEAGLRIRRIELAYAPGELVIGRLDAILVEGVRVSADVDAEGNLDLGPLQPLLEGGGGGGSGPLLLPAPRVSIVDVRAELGTPRGPVRLSAEADLKEAPPEAGPPGSVTGEIRLSARHEEMSGDVVVAMSGPLDSPTADVRVRPRISLPGLTIAGEPEITGRVQLGEDGARGEVEVPSLAIRYRAGDVEVKGNTPQASLAFEPTDAGTRARVETSGGALEASGYRMTGLAISADTDGEALSGSIDVDRIVDLAKPPLIAPLALALRFDGTLEEVALRGTAHDAKRALEIALSGWVRPTKASARVDFRAEPTLFGPDGADFARLFPSFAETFGEVSGHIAAHGHALLEDGTPDMWLDLALRDVDSVSETATIRRVNGTLAFQGYDPPISRGEQLLSIGLAEAGLPLTDGLIRWRLLPGWVIDVPSATFGVAGGEIRCGIRFDLDEEDVDVVLVALSLNLENLLSSVEFEGLAGSGTISGALPLRVSGDRVVMNAATLRGDAPGGTIRYEPDESAEAVARQQASSLGVAVQALSDLRWEVLELGLDGDTSESMQIQLRISGSNPEFQGGHPVQFNLNLEARLADLVRAGIESYRVPRTIEERLREFQNEPRSTQESP